MFKKILNGIKIMKISNLTNLRDGSEIESKDLETYTEE